MRAWPPPASTWGWPASRWIGSCRRTPYKAPAQPDQIVDEASTAEQPIWAIFDWPSVGDMDAKLQQQELLAALIATHPRLVVATGVVKPEPDAWPPLAEQWRLLGALRGMIRFARSGLLLSRVVTLPGS